MLFYWICYFLIRCCYRFKLNSCSEIVVIVIKWCCDKVFLVCLLLYFNEMLYFFFLIEKGKIICVDKELLRSIWNVENLFDKFVLIGLLDFNVLIMLNINVCN